MDQEPFILAELEDLSSVYAPLKATSRVKYTCMSVSANLLVMGASSGGLYIFRREPCVFLQLIPSKDGSVEQIAISPDERLLGVATARGTVNLLERNEKGGRVVASSFEHAGAVVTALTWGAGQLFVGDAVGRVSVLARTVFQPPAALLMQLDTSIVQLDTHASLLLVSTYTRCYVCDTERELYRQVGHKLRDGPFGGCFLSSLTAENGVDSEPTERARGAFAERTNLDYSHLKDLRLFCSRPGSRLWEVDAEGTVLRTHHLKEALNTQPRPITSDHTIDNNNRSMWKHEQSVNFGRVFVILTRYLLTYTSSALYVLDIDRSDVVLWCDQITDIVDVRVTANLIYVWCASGIIHALNLVPLEKFLIRMYFWKKYNMVSELCLEFNEYLQQRAPNSSKLVLLKDLDEKLKEEGASPAVLLRLAPLLEILRTNAQNTQIQNAQKLQSGIYQITRPSCLNLKHRSHSVSPDRLLKPAHGSTSSLPQLLMEQEDFDIAIDSDLVKSVVEICPLMNCDPKPEHVHELLSRVLKLSPDTKPLPFRAIFSNGQTNAIRKGLRSAMSSKVMLNLLKDLPLPDLSHPDIIKNNCGRHCLELDLKLSGVLRIFRDLLDEEYVLVDLKRLLPECYYMCLRELVTLFDASSMSLNDSLSPPRMLSVAAFLLKVGQMDQVIRWADKFDIRDIMYLIIGREEEEDSDGGHIARVCFLSIMNSRKVSAQEWLPLEQFIIHCLSKLDKLQVCECSFPIPTKYRAGSGERYLEVGNRLLNMKCDDMPAVVSICRSVPWLWPHVIHMRAHEPLLTLLPLILHLGHVDELERRLSEMDELANQVLMRHLVGLHRGDCLNCGRRLSNSEPGVSWTQAAMLLLKAVGHSATLRLLTQYQADVTSLEPVFHRAIVLSAIMEKHSPGLTHGVVDMLAGSAVRGTKSPSRAISDVADWGLRVDTRASCQQCQLPVNARVLTDQAGLCAFRCRHVFHRVCLRSLDLCPICRV